MHVVSIRPFRDAARDYPNDAQALMDIYRNLNRNSARYGSPEEMRRVYPSLDNFKYRDKWWVLDVGGNNLRIIMSVEFRSGTIFIKHIVTHAEYDKLTDRYRKGELT